MTSEAIYEKLEEILKTVKPKMDPARISMDASLTTDLGIDSLSMLLLSLAIEHEFGFQFQTQEPFKTVREVVEYIEKTV
jgi:NADH dehydrogenase (ubiquinone) 1 alpha/beta subcomplex 1